MWTDAAVMGLLSPFHPDNRNGSEPTFAGTARVFTDTGVTTHYAWMQRVNTGARTSCLETAQQAGSQQ